MRLQASRIGRRSSPPGASWSASPRTCSTTSARSQEPPCLPGAGGKLLVSPLITGGGDNAKTPGIEQPTDHASHHQK